jgi:hypothetical protein
MSDAGTLDALVGHLVEAVRPLARAFRDPEEFRVLLLSVGTAVDGLPDSYVTVADAATEAIAALERLRDGASTDELLAVAARAGDVFRAIEALDEAPPGLDPATFLPGLARNLFERLLGQALLSSAPRLFGALRLLDVIRFEALPSDGIRPPYAHLHFDWDQIPARLADPASIPERLVGWGTDDVDLAPLFTVLTVLANALDLQAGLDILDADDAAFVQDGPPASPRQAARQGMTVDLAEIALGDEPALVSLRFAELPPEGEAPAGLAIRPVVPSGLVGEIALSGGWSFAVRAGTDLADQFALLVRPTGVDVRFPGQPGHALPRAGFGLALAYDRGAPKLLFGQPGQSRLEVRGVRVATAVDVALDGSDVELRLDATVTGLALVVSGEGGDGFLTTVLGDDELRVDVPVTLSWSSRTGLHFATDAGFELTAHPGVDLGVVRIDRVDLALRLTAADGAPPALVLRAAAALSGALGPFAYVVDRLGVEAPVTFAPGNAGPVDVGLRPALPTGLGLAIATPEISGGGFLRFDPENGRYAGVFELTLLDTISVKAVAIITTKLPGGRPGFALLLLITAEGFTPLPLGLGFTLTGIGGLVALNRTIDVEAVRRGLSSGLLDSVLFAKDPVANAEGVLAALEQVFPLAPDRLLIGPLAEISWGSPPVVKIRLALLLEVPQPLRAVLLAALSVLLPDPERAVVELHVDAIGVLDLGRGELALDASLHHSRLWKFGLTGDMALRLNWGDDPTFLLSIGGFHPRFTPPAGLRPLQRITFSLSGSDNPRIRFESYLAVTSNTIQLGARVTLRAEKGGFGVDGGGAFDALVQWSPFGLAVDFEAWVKVFSPVGTLFAARLKVAVTGPQPWHVKGSISFDVLWWTVSAGVDFTIGEALPPAPLVTVDVAALLVEELARPQSWSSTLPPGVAPGVTLAGADPTELLVHPLASLSVRQKVVPLGTRVTRMGAQRPRAGTRTYDLDVDGPPGLTGEALTDQFALAQYTELTEDQKLAAPSFTRLPAGVSFGPTAARALPTDRSVTTDLAFETLDLTDLDLPATAGAAPAPAAPGLLDAERSATAGTDRASLQVVPA